MECMHIQNVNKVVHSGFETQTKYDQNLKIGLSVAPQKGVISSRKGNVKINFLKTDSPHVVSVSNMLVEMKLMWCGIQFNFGGKSAHNGRIASGWNFLLLKLTSV